MFDTFGHSCFCCTRLLSLLHNDDIVGAHWRDGASNQASSFTTPCRGEGVLEGMIVVDITGIAPVFCDRMSKA